MAGNMFKWLVPCVITVVGGTALAIAATGDSLSSDLSAKARAALGPDATWADVSLDGREALISGVAADHTTVDSAVARVAAVSGIAGATANVEFVPTVRPFPFSAEAGAAGLSLSGGIPSADAGRILLADAGDGATQSLKLLGGSADPVLFTSAAGFAIEAARHLDQGRAELADLSLSIEGRAKSLDDYAWLQSLPGVPAAVSVAQVSVEPPAASPYVLSLSFDGTTVAVSGDAPDSDFERALRDAVPASVPVTFALTPASGSTSDFKAKVLGLLKSLLMLQSGEARLSDATATLSGVPASVDISQAVTTAVASLGGTATLEAPHGADYTLGLTKADGKLSFAGLVPDKATRDRLAAVDGASTDGLTIGKGAPEHFAAGVDFGLAILSHLTSGVVDLKGARLSLGGLATSVADYKAVEALADKGVDGFTVTSGDLEPPTASPFTWSATKGADGSIAMTGFVPDDAARNALHAKIATPGDDRAAPAQGAPANFVLLAGKGLDVLALLDTGSVSFDGTAWSIVGNVDSAKKGFAADAAYSVAGLRTAGWSYTITAPTPPASDAANAAPAVTPYLWSATKAADGTVTVAGYLPDAAAKAAVAAKIGAGGQDTTALASGQPSGFENDVLSGLDALGHLGAGRAAFDGSHWLLTGTPASDAEGAAAKAAVGVDWNVALMPVMAASSSAASEASSTAISSSSEPSSASVEMSSSVEASSASSSEAAAPSAIASSASASMTEPASSSAAPSSSAPEASSSASEVSSTPPSSMESSMASSEASSSSASSSSVAPPAPATPMPTTLLFDAAFDGAQMVLKGGAPSAAAASVLAKAAGVSAKSLKVTPGLPDTFVASANSGMSALAQLDSGRLGFDGTTWWLRGAAATQAQHDAVAGVIAALPNASDWSVAIDVASSPLVACRERVTSLAKRNAIQFTTGKATLTKDSQATLDQLAADLKICPDTNVHVQGHTDADGSAAANLGLSVARAEAVIAALVQRGIVEDRLIAEGYGSSVPIASNDTKAGKAANRRIAFEIDPQ